MATVRRVMRAQACGRWLTRSWRTPVFAIRITVCRRATPLWMATPRQTGPELIPVATKMASSLFTSSAPDSHMPASRPKDRKHVVEGKRGSVSLDFVGHHIHKKKKTIRIED